MSNKKLNQAHVLSRLITDDSFTNTEAAELMCLSIRQVIRLKGEFKKYGAESLVHKSIGRTPSHAISEEMRKKIITLKNTKPFDPVNFKHFQEILARKKYGVKICYSSLYQIMRCEGITSPKKRRSSKKHRNRKRKSREGILLQIDASPHDWLNTGQKQSLHGSIDDATGKITALYLCKNECLQGYFEIMRETITNNGIPISIYSDRHSIFVSPKDSKLTVEDELKGITVNKTQFGRAMEHLGITLIKARSAPAKGRVERLWETLQSRLPIELALADIKDIDAANEFFKQYINDFNALFSVEPEYNEISYRELSPGINIENILCVYEKRTFDSGGVFSFHNKSFKILAEEHERALPHRGKITVLVSPSFGIRALFAGIILEVIPYIKPKKVSAKAKTQKKTGKYIPPDTHYFKYGHKLIKKVTFEDSDLAILKMLERIFLQEMDSAV